MAKKKKRSRGGEKSDGGALGSPYCLSCGREESYPRGPDTVYVCSSCVQDFLKIDVDDARVLYDKAVADGNNNRVEALEMVYKFR